MGGWPNGGDYGPLGYPSGGGFGLPCDFGTCGAGANGFAPAAAAGAAGGATTLWGVVFTSEVWAAAAAGAAAGIIVAGAVALPYDIYKGYQLAQAYGYIQPNATSVPNASVRPHPPDVEKACSDALYEFMMKPRRGHGDPGSCYAECIYDNGKWPDYKCPR
jgi:hypothetical protein